MKFAVINKHVHNKYGFLEIFIPLYGILSYYVLPIVSSIGMIIIYLYAFVRIIKSCLYRKEVFYINKSLLAFVVYAICTQPIVYLLYGGFNNSRLFNYLSIMLMFMVICVCTQKINVDNLFKVYLIVGCICSVATVLQSIQLYVFGIKVYPIVLLPIDTSGWFLGGTRPCGFFPEPQAFATYILPLLYYMLKKHDFRWVVFFSISILFSTSSLGIISTIILLCYYLLSSDTKKIYKFGTVFAVIIGLFILRNTAVYDYAINKILETDFTSNSRLTHGFDIFNKLTFQQKIWGIGKNNIAYFIANGNVVLTDSISIAMYNSAYVTSISDILIGFGVVGFLLYLFFLLRHIAKYENNMFIFLLFVLSFAQTIFLNSAWVFWMIIYFNIIEIKSSDFYKLRIK